MNAANESLAGRRGPLVVALLVLLAVVWIEPFGSSLAEPDETRYAEIPREMLAAGDLVVPRLNGLPYFEKPPLLYWVNAASLRIFGETPWAARLPTRLAGTGTAALVFVAALGAGLATTSAAAAAILFLTAPIGFLFARTNLTDGLLTFFFTATLLAARGAVRRREDGRSWASLAALAGGCAAAAFLTKGLIAIVLPGAIVVAWAAATRRLVTAVRVMFLSPAPFVFAVLVAPWLILAEGRHPGFIQFFFIHEHLQRFATGSAKRTGAVWYFVPVFVLGFLPGLVFFLRGLARSLRPSDESFFFLLWFAIVFVFFSLSGSKLPPYLFPAIPAAAVLAARGLPAEGRRGAWLAQAALATAFTAAVFLVPAVRSEVSRPDVAGILAPALAILVLGSWAAVLFARNARPLAVACVAIGWAAFCAGVSLGWPRMPQARMNGELATAAKAAARERGAPIVGYRDYLNGLSWELKTPIPVADYAGELEPWFEMRPEVRDALYWPKEKFWDLWASGKPVVALVRMKDLVAMMTATPPARVVKWSGRHAIVVNW
ncbi:MAG TPA: phospholipid carrier-dependent glycosyltransferase [Thermoanaerobaculia bacterium]|nr:phospholipid carrier-dependent glycosyltransferase [Thermoanaerobaculia bacterium]